MTKSNELKKKKVTFKIKAEKGAKIFVAGSFNGWSMNQHRLNSRNGAFSTSIMLSRGRHEYKFVVNGEWQPDTECSDWIQNEHGTINSVIRI
ncbi:glycogen-binding domain-containing protein [Fibrobacterota bacterium]